MKKGKSKININNSIKEFDAKFIILEKILSLVEEKKKLNIIKYNKNYQTKLKININNYKRESGKEIIYEDKGILKEYILGVNHKELLFEGEYLNDKRNGKGKEYIFGNELIFEGEYLNGKRWNGKGKEYNYNGKLEFEGEYLNGQKNGKEFNEDGSLKLKVEHQSETTIKKRKFNSCINI